MHSGPRALQIRQIIDEMYTTLVRTSASKTLELLWKLQMGAKNSRFYCVHIRIASHYWMSCHIPTSVYPWLLVTVEGGLLHNDERNDSVVLRLLCIFNCCWSCWFIYFCIFYTNSGENWFYIVLNSATATDYSFILYLFHVLVYRI